MRILYPQIQAPLPVQRFRILSVQSHCVSPKPNYKHLSAIPLTQLYANLFFPAGNNSYRSIGKDY